MKEAIDGLVLVNLCLVALVQLAYVAKLALSLPGSGRGPQGKTEPAQVERKRIGQVTE